MVAKKKKAFDKYVYYENSVQSPEHHAEWFGRIFHEVTGRTAHSWREDFCGTAAMSVEWVKLHPKNTAIGVDLDPEPLEYHTQKHLPKLKPEVRKRIQTLNKNVLDVHNPKVDLITACNFSYCIFKERALLIRYLKGVRQSLKKGGIAILDLAGGPGMIAPMRERKTLSSKETGKFKYVWHQRNFDPITHNAQYSIHFQLSTGEWKKDAFTYDWRLWTIPEVRECMKEAGFKNTCVYWETSHKGEGTGEYIRMESGDNAFAWVAYIVGQT